MNEQVKEVQSIPLRKFLFISFDALLTDLAWKITKEGCLVKFYTQNKSERSVGDGFIEKADEWEKFKDWADIIVFDDCGFGNLPDKLRKEGKLVIGGNTYTDKLELDREFGQQEMKDSGLNVPPFWDFESFDPAIDFVKKNPGRYVIKPNGKAQNDKVLSFIGQEEDGLDLLTILERYKRFWSSKIRSFQIQKYVSGVEVAVGTFFNGKDFILPACINFEHKKMFNDEIGPTTGEMGTSMFWTSSNRLISETILKMKDKLAKSNFIGYFDVNCIVNSRGAYPLEITSRFGYPTINIQMEGVQSKWSDFFIDLAKGENFNLKVKKGFQIGVVIAVPPFPFIDPQAFQKYSEDAVVIFKKPLSDNIHPCDIKLVDNDWVLTGNSGYSLIVTGSGNTMEEAKKETYNIIKHIIIPNMFYRTDIGNRWREEGDLLQTWGWL
ncbi:MAG: phosphoribosylamine--glycine ligase [Candidatus Firestonebacteria bacterium]